MRLRYMARLELEWACGSLPCAKGSQLHVRNIYINDVAMCILQAHTI